MGSGFRGDCEKGVTLTHAYHRQKKNVSVGDAGAGKPLASILDLDDVNHRGFSGIFRCYPSQGKRPLFIQKLGITLMSPSIQRVTSRWSLECETRQVGEGSSDGEGCPWK